MTANANPAPHPLSIANYRSYWIVRFTSMLALYSMMLIIGWQAYNIARETMSIEASAARLALIGFLQFLPLFFLTPVTGWVADHQDRRLVVRIVLIALSAIAGLLAVMTSSGSMSLNLLFGIAVLLGICRAFIGPAQAALAPNLVPKASLPTAIALSSIAWQSGMLIGPAMAGPLYAIEPHLPYTVSAILYAVSAIAMFTIGVVPRSTPARLGPLAQIAEGARYVAQNKLVLGVITLDLFAVFLAGATALIPVFARDILDVADPETALSLLAASPAAGAAIIALFFSFVPMKKNVGNRMLISVFVFGLATVSFGFSTILWLSMACLFICGAADMFSVYVRGSLIQLNTPDDKRGRVGAVSQLTISASNELGEAESGLLASIIGPQAAVITGGIGAMIITGLWLRLFPQIGAATSFEPATDVADSEPVAHINRVKSADDTDPQLGDTKP